MLSELYLDMHLQRTTFKANITLGPWPNISIKSDQNERLHGGSFFFNSMSLYELLVV